MNDWDKYPLNLLSRPQVEKAVEESAYFVADMQARELLSNKRFDIYAKLVYIDHKVKRVDMKYALDIYKRHLEVITGYTFIEYGQPDKNSFAKYVECFDHLIDVFQREEYDPSLSLIPVDKNNIPIDGSHRVSCAVYFNQKVKVVKFENYESPDYSCHWFNEHYLLETTQNAISLEFCNWHSDIYMACLWPTAFMMKQLRHEAVRLMEHSVRIVSSCRIDLGQNGLRNFLIQVYGFMPWTGTVANHFSGIYSKLNEISSANNSTVEFFLFQADDLDKVLEMKEQIRNLFKLDKGAVHITDNAEETRQIARLIYNTNSVHHLKYACPDKYVHSYEMCMEFKSLLLNNGYKLSDYIIDSSAVMAIYGIREAGDLDYLTTESGDRKRFLHQIEADYMECHDKYEEYHDVLVREMLIIPQNYFIFSDIKFLSLERVKQFKQNKGEPKDLLDIRLIESFNSTGDKYNYRILLLRNYYRRKKAYVRSCIKKMIRFVLVKLRLLEFVKKRFGRRA